MSEPEDRTPNAESRKPDLLARLNPEQRAAVEHGEGPLLVLAGAGSGKTRVIVHRLARLIEQGVRPWKILAVTFTNKAAGEMLSRVQELAGGSAGDAWVSTFHAAGVRILRRDGHKIGLPRGFTIYDDSDQLSLAKRVLKEIGVDDKKLPPRDVLAQIDRWKNRGLLPEQVTPGRELFAEDLVRAYARYEDALRGAGAVDFGDLLLRVVQLLRVSPDTRELYRRRFEHLLVDEFQDTNPVQYELLRLLCPDDRSKANLCVVGDDDQSIYRWRGADVGNILKFPEDFPGARVVKLERNYRSTRRILDAAYGVISHNRARADKRLRTDGETGSKLRLHVAADDREEAARIADTVRSERSAGRRYGQIAIFYRTNAQSRLIEEALRQRALPYLVFRGRSFYDRAEIRDVVAWLRLVANPKSNEDFLRAVGSPPRGIGEATLERLAAHARERGLTLWDAVPGAASAPGISAGAAARLAAFRALVESFQARAATLGAAPVVQAVVAESGYLDRLAADPRGEGEDRQQNVREFVRAAGDFDRAWSGLVSGGDAAPAADEPDGFAGRARLAALRAVRGDAEEQPPSALEAFLAQIAVLGDSDEEEKDDRVSLMTLHSAKGLEFDTVFLAGLEDTLFPSARSVMEQGGLEEERRLCYVGLTRARRQVHLTLARRRALFGDVKENDPSPFLHEIPPELVDGIELLDEALARPPVWSVPSRTQVRRRPPAGEYVERDPDATHGGDDFDQRPAAARLRPPGGRLGVRVRHENFGEGLVVSTRGTGPDARVDVMFPGVGLKKVLARYLDPI